MAEQNDGLRAAENGEQDVILEPMRQSSPFGRKGLFKNI